MLDANRSALPPVLFVGDHLGYPGGVAHGVTTYLLEVLPSLRAAGVELAVVFLRGPHEAARQLRRHGIDPVFYDAPRLDPTVALRVVHAARAHGSRLIHAAGIKATLVARLAARATGARALLHVHDRIVPGPAVARLHAALARPSDLGICVAGGVRDVAIHGYHVSPERVRVVPNGIALARVREVKADARARLRAGFGMAHDAPLIGVVGRLFPVKGQRGLLRVWPQIRAAVPGARLLVIGDGPDRAACEAEARARGCAGSVAFLGQRADVPDLLHAVDLVLVPSESEGLPICAIEALCVGRPVVAYDVGGVREVVDDGRNGVVVPAADGAAFARAVVALLRDPARLAGYGDQARADADRFDLSCHVESLLRCYREVAWA